MSPNDRRAAVPPSTINSFEFANTLAASGHADAAIEMYRTLLAKHPRLCPVLNNLATVLRQQGHLDEAAALTQKAIRIAPQDGTLHTNLGHIRLGQGRVADALVHYRKAVLLSPAVAEGYNGLGRALIAAGASADAIAPLQRALELDPHHLFARINLGLALVDQGHPVEALDHAGIVARSSDQAHFPHFQTGVLLARAGCPDGARACFHAYLAGDPHDGMGARLMLGALGDELPACASLRQIEQLYGSRAPHWDHKVGGETAYRGAELVAAMVDRLAEPGRLLDIVDAGCGTGLVGALVKHRARALAGVDMSLPMLRKAEEKGIYGALHQGDLVAHLSNRADSCHLITSAATLIHFGDLRPVFQAAAQSLRDGGLFVFTLFPNEADDDAIAVETLDGFAQGGCFRHGRNHVTQASEATGFHVEDIRLETHEYFQGKAKMALVVGLRRRIRGDVAPPLERCHIAAVGFAPSFI